MRSSREPAAVSAARAAVTVGLPVLAAVATSRHLLNRVRLRRAGLDVAVARRLATSQRTWHVPPIEVRVEADVIVLSGVVAHDGTRRALVAEALSVPGVDVVSDRLFVVEPSLGVLEGPDRRTDRR
ncbi:MAG: hypothetical protein S0880_10670 [Actinomycetota bacterium]|nr:hypothetical protein [Actinomycetota bacterium]